MKPKVSSLVLLNSHFFVIECETTFLTSFEDCSEVVVLVSLGGTVDNDIITYIFDTWQMAFRIPQQVIICQNNNKQNNTTLN